MNRRIAVFVSAIASAVLMPGPASSLQRRGAPDLARYAGRYPFDPVGGVRFLNHPLVRRAVANAAPSGRIGARILARGTSGEIIVTRTMVLAWACEPHNCGSHNWSIAIGRRNRAQFVCYKPDRGSARWYFRRRAVASGEGCPFEAAEVPTAVLGAL